MEVGAPEVASLHPELLVAAESGVVEFLERVVAGHEYVPLYDGESIIPGQVSADALVEEHFEKHDGGPFRIDIFLRRGCSTISGVRRIEEENNSSGLKVMSWHSIPGVQTTYGSSRVLFGDTVFIYWRRA